MPHEIDRNDVDITRLFHWTDSFMVETRSGETPVYMRVVGDAEFNQAKVYALRKSAELRRNLRDNTSDEHLAYVPQMGDFEESQLLENLLLLYKKDLTSEAIRVIRIPLPVEPSSEASLEARENYQKEIDEYPEKRVEQIKKYVEVGLTDVRNKLSGKTEEQLYKEYIKRLIDVMCENELNQTFLEKCIYFGTYKDEGLTERLFESFEVFMNIPSEIKEQLFDFYKMLEIDSETLKKSPAP